MSKSDLSVDTAHSQHITDHPFDPGKGNPWWGLCKSHVQGKGKVCNLSEPAHRYSTITPEERAAIIAMTPRAKPEEPSKP